MKATIASLIFLLLSLAVSSQTYKYIGIEEGLSNQKIYRIPVGGINLVHT